jgi:hypothetical protein
MIVGNDCKYARSEYLFNAKSQSKSTFIKRRGHLEKKNRRIKYIFKLSARIVSKKMTIKLELHRIFQN